MEGQAKPPQQDKQLSEKNISGTSAKGIIIFVFAIIILGSSAVFTVQQNTGKQNSIDQQEKIAKISPTLESPIAPYTLVYGAWTGEGSIIKSFNLHSGENETLALLPINIKKVSIVSSDRLLFINKTDERDYGKEIASYSITNGKTETPIKATDGFGIDEYVISPNKKYIAIWEVSIPENATTLNEGQSRVYTASLDNPSQKHLIYDEPAKNPVHYPRAILDDGKVFMDTFQANDQSGGTGWAYGMSVADFEGKKKEDISEMESGTYGTQPYLSEDGSKLLFVGYDQSNGSGTNIKNGYRQAILTPNTVETLDTTTLKREKIVEASSQTIYSSVKWTSTPDSIIINKISPNKELSGKYIYDMRSKALTKINLEQATGENIPALITTLTSNKSLIGTTDNSSSTVANLGETYSSAFKQFLISDTTQKITQTINLPDPFMQYIAILPNDYITDIKAMNLPTEPTQTLVETKNSNGKQESVQLYTFFLKADLGPKRETQQTNIANPPHTENPPHISLPPGSSTTTIKKAPPNSPKCKELAREQCASQGHKDDTSCVVNTQLDNKFAGNCHDSPLYLYGLEGMNVGVKIHTPVHSSTPSYNNGYDVTLLGNGTFAINNKVYSKIEYAYIAALKKIIPPPYGAFVNKDEVEHTLRAYARGLGLNEKETQDLVAVGKMKVTSPYAFISFFDHKTSQAILPISFTPKPDNYLNVVFYFKLLNEKPPFTINPPLFSEPIKRIGFTAIEVSEIVE